MLSHVSWKSVWVGSVAGGACYCVCVKLLACRWVGGWSRDGKFAAKGLNFWCFFQCGFYVCYE